MLQVLIELGQQPRGGVLLKPEQLTVHRDEETTSFNPLILSLGVFMLENKKHKKLKHTFYLLC